MIRRKRSSVDIENITEEMIILENFFKSSENIDDIIFNNITEGDIHTKIRFCGAVLQYEASINESDKKFKEAKLIEIFIKNPLFQVDALVKRYKTSKDNFLILAKYDVLTELSKNEIICKYVKKF